jgi:hypothetical protein
MKEMFHATFISNSMLFLNIKDNTPAMSQNAIFIEGKVNMFRVIAVLFSVAARV